MTHAVSSSPSERPAAMEAVRPPQPGDAVTLFVLEASDCARRTIRNALERVNGVHLLGESATAVEGILAVAILKPAVVLVGRELRDADPDDASSIIRAISPATECVRLDRLTISGIRTALHHLTVGGQET